MRVYQIPFSCNALPTLKEAPFVCKEGVLEVALVLEPDLEPVSGPDIPLMI
jgi:hypothetical protein